MKDTKELQIAVLERIELSLRLSHDEADVALQYAHRMSQEITDIVYPVELAARRALSAIQDRIRKGGAA